LSTWGPDYCVTVIRASSVTHGTHTLQARAQNPPHARLGLLYFSDARACVDVPAFAGAVQVRDNARAV